MGQVFVPSLCPNPSIPLPIHNWRQLQLSLLTLQPAPTIYFFPIIKYLVQFERILIILLDTCYFLSLQILSNLDAKTLVNEKNLSNIFLPQQNLNLNLS